MGCSPSKGHNFGTLGSMRKSRMLPSAPQEISRQCAEDENNCISTISTNVDTKERKTSGHTQVFKEAYLTQTKRSVPEPAPEAVNIVNLGGQGMDNSAASQKKEKQHDKQHVKEKKSGRKPKKNTRGTKVLKKKDKDKLCAEHKVDFPELLVKAHQAAYAFLNPSIYKYDILLGLLEQATETHFSVQPMVAFMTLRYDEIIQGLKEMADEGEKVLKENGEHLAWTSQMKNLSSSAPLNSGFASTEPPPDLLQQLLQYTTQRMRNVSHTVGGIGDSALEEAVEYFASISEVLEEKLRVKHAVETRLLQILSRIEMASQRKPGPEDSALFSEDSGIGAESESLAGFERRHRRESCESTGTNRATPVSHMEYTSMNITQGALKKKLQSKVSPSVSLTSLNSLSSKCTIMANNDQTDSLLGSVSFDDGEEDDNDDQDKVERGMTNVQVGIRKRSNSSPVNYDQHPRRLPQKRIENPQNVEMTLKMKNAISDRIQFVPSENTSAKTRLAGSPRKSTQQWTNEENQSVRRPQTAAPFQKALVKRTTVTGQRRSRSEESLRSKGEDPTLLELERTKKDLNQRLQSMSKSKAGVNTRTAPSKHSQGSSPAQSPAIICKQPTLEKHSNPQPIKGKSDLKRQNNKNQDETNVAEDEKLNIKITSNGPLKATPPPSPPPSPRPSSGLHRGRNSVRKLIDTFSQGIEERDDLKVLGPLKGVRRCGVPVLPGLGNMESVLSTGLTSCRPDSISPGKTDDLDLDSLPPPPLEVLMDNSFEGVQSPSTIVPDDGSTKVSKSPLLKRTVVSQKLRASVKSATVLPSKGGLPHTSKVASFVKTGQQDASTQSNSSQQDAHLGSDTGNERYFLHQQARKIIHLRTSSGSQTESSSTSYVETNPPSGQEESVDFQGRGNKSLPRPDAAVPTSLLSSVVNSQQPATPPKSRSRMLPSTPSTPSSLHQRRPSPNLKRQPTPPSSASSPINRKLPTPPSIQRMLPSQPVAKHISASYTFKAPSPPASPKVQRWSRENSSDSSQDSSSTRMISNARSVFCPVSPSLFEAQPCSIPRQPEAWTSTGMSFFSHRLRGFPVSVQGPRPFVQRSHSDRRPSLNFPKRPLGISVAETCGSEPAISSQGLDNEPTKDDELWGNLSDLRATLRSASHPDLCVVGQALYKD